MFHHGSQSDRNDGYAGADAEFWQSDRSRCDHFRLCDSSEVHFAHQDRSKVGNQNTDEDRNDFYHALAPDVTDDDDTQRNQSQEPVGACTADSSWCKDQTDGDDDWAGYNRWEEFHDRFDAADGNQKGHDNINQTCNKNTAASVWEHFGVSDGSFAVGIQQHWSNSRITAEESEAGAQECRNFTFGDQMEEQSAQTCHQQSGGYIQTGHDRNQNGCAKHGEGMLQTQQDHLWNTQLTGIVNAFLADACFVFSTHRSLLCFSRNIAYFTAFYCSRAWSRLQGLGENFITLCFSIEYVL